MFSPRIKKRLKLWWDTPNDCWKSNKFIDLIIRYRQTHIRMFKDDPVEKWHKGKYWQRKLANKWNSRQFALKYGCPVPELYWYGRRVGDIKISTFPGQFVIKPVLGYSRHGVYVICNNLDLMSGQIFSAKNLLNDIKKTHGRISFTPLIAEEFIRSEDGSYKLPFEYKCHVFGSEVAAIQVISRASASKQDARHRFYTPLWEAIDDQMSMGYELDIYTEPPKCLDQILFWAKKLGEAYGTYVRADFYASDRGCIFGEFSSTPHQGEGYTDFAQSYFEEYWERNLGDAI